MPTLQSISWKPRSFQVDGVKLMVGQACAGLLFPPGGGKTSACYMAFCVLQGAGYVDKMLVICPVRPMYRVWPHQKDKYDEFKHLRVAVLHGKDKEELLHSTDYDIYVINPEGLPWLLDVNPDGRPDAKRLKLVAAKFPMLVVDESTKFKNPQTARFKMLRTLVAKFKRRYILTGSFTSRGLLDLFGQVYIMDEGQALGRYITHYRTNFFYPSGYGGYDWIPQPDADKRIGERIAQLVLRVDLKESGVDLPDLLFDDIYVDLPPPARKQYVLMENALVARLEAGNVVAANAAVASSKCRQIANGILFDSEEQGKWHVIHSEKLDALEDLIEQLQGEPLLITYEFKPDAERIAKALKVVNISSGNAKRDDANIELFSKGLITNVMGHPDSIALGIDGLQDSCCHIAMFGVTWNLLNYQQVIDRVHRQGNKSKKVIVHRILARDTLDERVLKVLDSREKNQAAFLKLLKGMRR